MERDKRLVLITCLLLIGSVILNVHFILNDKIIVQHTYLPSDIMRVDYKNLDVYFEQGGDPLEFSNINELTEYVENTTAYATCIHGYKDNLDWLIRQGYIYAITVHNDNEQYTELVYKGPNWTYDTQDPTRDTSYIISTFNNVEKLYDPRTNTQWYESYTID